MNITITTSDDDDDDDGDDDDEQASDNVYGLNKYLLDGVIMTDISKMKQQRGDGVDLIVVGHLNILMKRGTVESC